MVAPGRESQLITAFVELADTLVKTFDVADLLHNLVGHCVDLLNLESAGLLLCDERGNLQVIASSSERTRLLELLQLETNTGPCIECFQTGRSVSAPDLAAIPEKWPLFVERARRDGYSAVHAFPVRVDEQNIGVLSFFAAEAGDLDRTDLLLGQALADMAGVGLLQDLAIRETTTIADQIETVVKGRVVIERAKGLIAEAGSLDMDEAFARLRMFVRSKHSSLAEVAEQLVNKGLEPNAVLQNNLAVTARKRSASARPAKPSTPSPRSSAGTGRTNT